MREALPFVLCDLLLEQIFDRGHGILQGFLHQWNVGSDRSTAQL